MTFVYVFLDSIRFGMISVSRIHISRVPVKCPDLFPVSSGKALPHAKPLGKQAFRQRAPAEKVSFEGKQLKTKGWRLFQMIPFRQAQQGKGITPR